MSCQYSHLFIKLIKVNRKKGSYRHFWISLPLDLGFASHRPPASIGSHPHPWILTPLSKASPASLTQKRRQQPVGREIAAVHGRKTGQRPNNLPTAAINGEEYSSSGHGEEDDRSREQNAHYSLQREKTLWIGRSHAELKCLKKKRITWARHKPLRAPHPPGLSVIKLGTLAPRAPCRLQNAMSPKWCLTV